MKRSAELSDLDLEYFHGLTIPPLSQSGGGAPPQLQEKSILITQNGNSQVTPDQGYDGLYLVSLNTQVPERLPEMNLNTTILQNTTTTLLPAPGYVLTSLQITTQVPANTTTLTTNLQYLQQTFNPTGFDGFSRVSIKSGNQIAKIAILDKRMQQAGSVINVSDFTAWLDSPDQNWLGKTYLVFYDYYNEFYIEKNGSEKSDMFGPLHYYEITNQIIEWEDIGGIELKDANNNVLISFIGTLSKKEDGYEEWEDPIYHLGFHLARPFLPAFSAY